VVATRTPLRTGHTAVTGALAAVSLVRALVRAGRPCFATAVGEYVRAQFALLPAVIEALSRGSLVYAKVAVQGLLEGRALGALDWLS